MSSTLFVSIALLDAHTLPHTQAGRCPVQPQAAAVSRRAALLTGRHHVPCLGVKIIPEGRQGAYFPSLKRKLSLACCLEVTSLLVAL